MFKIGGSIPVFDEITLSTSLMDEIIDFDPQSGKEKAKPREAF